MITLNFDPPDDSPLHILPLSSLLIFSAISFLASNVGLQLISKQKDFIATTEKYKIDYVTARSLADFFITTSGRFAIASLLIMASAFMFAFGMNIEGWILKFIVFLLFSWCFVMLGYFILIVMRIKNTTEAEDYQKLYIEFLNKPNP